MNVACSRLFLSKRQLCSVSHTCLTFYSKKKQVKKRGIIKEQVSEKEIKEQSVSGNKVTKDH